MDDSTSNLLKHISTCDLTKAHKTETITAYANGHTYNPAQMCIMCYLLAKWVSRQFQPFAIVEDPELIAIFQMLYGHAQIPSGSTVSGGMKEIFELTKISVKKLLQVCLYVLHCT